VVERRSAERVKPKEEGQHYRYAVRDLDVLEKVRKKVPERQPR
jgi:hypothetical protein